MIREKRYRNFVAIGYPESLVPNWVDILADTHIQFVISPLHDKDVNPDGEIKKEHYHIMLMYEAPHTYEQAQEKFYSIGATKCEVVNSLRGQARYLCHLDNQEKYQYPTSEVRCLNGVDYQTLTELPSDKRAALKEIISFIKANDIYCFDDLLDYALENNESWFNALSENYTLVTKEYLKSRSWKLEHANLSRSK